MKKLAILGDIHASFEAFDLLLDEVNADYIIQCGDFGVWNLETKNALMYSGKVPVYWLRGNHENHDMLDNIYGKDDGKHKIMPMQSDYFPYAENIFLCNSGTVLELGTKKILMLGGADSIDKDRRVEFASWWRQEIPSKKCQENVLSGNYNAVDIVISHTAPAFIQKKMPLAPPPNSFTSDPNYHDPTTDYLETCFKKIKAQKNNQLKLWVYGHFHIEFRHKTKDCNFIALNMYDKYSEYLRPSCYTVVDI